MERSRGIEHLRKRGAVNQKEFIDCTYTQTSISAIIKRLISVSPSERPTANDLLSLVFTEANVDKTKLVEEVKALKLKVNAQEATIHKQEELILQKVNELENLKRQLNSKS